MADANKTLITRAEVTSILTPATGRKALVIDGATIELGNTGIRDLSGIFDAGKVSAGKATVQRIGNTVTWMLEPVTLPAGATHPWVIISNTGGRLNGFLPTVLQARSTLITTGLAPVRFVVGANGNVEIHYGVASSSYAGTLTFVTEAAWPTTLPGVANGQPVGV